MSITSKEARETKYWIKLLISTDYLDINESHTKSLLDDITELIKFLTSITKQAYLSLNTEHLTSKGTR